MKKENGTKQKIREVAFDLFERKSFDEVTLIEICEAANVNKHTFYYYFKSKDELLDKHYTIPHHLSCQDIASILDAESYVEQMWLSNKSFIDFVEQSGPGIMKQLFIKNLSKDMGTFTITDEQREFFKLQMSIIDKGKAADQFRTNIETKALLLISRQVYHATAMGWCIKNAEFNFTERVRYMYENIFDVAQKYRRAGDIELFHF